MDIRTDDEVYRVDAVWLGPPKATFPWEIRYVSWGIGFISYIVIFAFVHQVMGVERSFFSFSWVGIAMVIFTKAAGKKITHERPFGAVVAMLLRNVGSPRRLTASTGSAATASHLRVNAERPRKAPSVDRRDRRQRRTRLRKEQQ